jgi:hypothetical protein
MLHRQWLAPTVHKLDTEFLAGRPKPSPPFAQCPGGHRLGGLLCGFQKLRGTEIFQRI